MGLKSRELAALSIWSRLLPDKANNRAPASWVSHPAKASAGCPGASFNCGSSLPQELRTTS
jgi:hypothetical protein